MTALPYALAACFVALVLAWCFVQWLHAERDTSAVRREMAALRTEMRGDLRIACEIMEDERAKVEKYEDRIALLELKQGMQRG